MRAEAGPEAGHGGLVFVTGASRSGTTMLSRSLGNHPCIAGLNELHFLGDLMNPESANRPLDADAAKILLGKLLARQANNIFGAPAGGAEFEDAERLLADATVPVSTGFDVFGFALHTFAARSGCSIACEQTPRNIYYADRLLSRYPECRVIHLLRDPRAVLASQKNRWKMRRLGGSGMPRSELLRTWINYHPFTMTRLWIRATERALALRDHERFHLLRFEDIVTHPERALRNIAGFLNIGFAPEMLEVPHWGSSNLEHGGSQKGISSKYANRWSGILSSSELSIVQRQAGRFMKEFEYPLVPESGSPVLGLIRQSLTYPIHLGGVMLANPKRAWTQLRAIVENGSMQ